MPRKINQTTGFNFANARIKKLADNRKDNYYALGCTILLIVFFTIMFLVFQG